MVFRTVALPPRGTLVRALGVRALAANIVNSTVGSGIFVLPAAVAAILGASSIIAYFVCAAAIGLVALCFAEAGSRVSRTGGAYAYVETAFGPYVGFLAGALFWFGSEVISSAAVAVVLIGSLGALLPAVGGALPRAVLLAVLFAALAAANIRGVLPARPPARARLAPAPGARRTRPPPQSTAAPGPGASTSPAAAAATRPPAPHSTPGAADPRRRAAAPAPWRRAGAAAPCPGPACPPAETGRRPPPSTFPIPAARSA
jgi:hypothetical protein